MGRREPGSTSIMITMPMRKKRDCYAAPVRQLSSASTGEAVSMVEDKLSINTNHWPLGREREMSTFEVPASADMRWSSRNFAF